MDCRCIKFIYLSTIHGSWIEYESCTYVSCIKSIYSSTQGPFVTLCYFGCNINLRIWHRLKFGHCEKHIKFEKIFLMVLTYISADLFSKCQNHEEDFFSNYVCFSKGPNFDFVSMFVHQHDQTFSFYFIEFFFHRPVILFN